MVKNVLDTTLAKLILVAATNVFYNTKHKTYKFVNVDQLIYRHKSNNLSNNNNKAYLIALPYYRHAYIPNKSLP